MRDSESQRREITWIRARNVAYTIVQLGGFALVFWGLFELFRPALVEYYQSESSAVTGYLSELSSIIPVLDQLTALVIFAAGAVIVWFSTA